MAQLIVAPSVGPNKKFMLASETRPISLFRVLAKLLEAIVYVRMLAAAGSAVRRFQYAYFRGRGTEMYLQELRDAAQRSLRGEKSPLITIVDIDGAFDRAPR